MIRASLLASHLRGLLRALRVRGLPATCGILWHQFRDRGFDRRHGTDTDGHVDVRRLEDGREGAASAMPYVPSRARALRRLFASLPLPRTGAFVDLGCGKGRAMALAAEAGFAQVRGVELSPHLAAIARDNLARLGRAFPHASFEVLEGDLGALSVLPTDQVFHAFHPCERQVLGRAFERIAASLREHPRTVFVLWQDNLAGDLAVPEFDGLLTAHTIVLHGSRYVVCAPGGANLGGIGAKG